MQEVEKYANGTRHISKWTVMRHLQSKAHALAATLEMNSEMSALGEIKGWYNEFSWFGIIGFSW